MENIISKEPLVRILMATYNGQKYLDRQLRSIVNQRYNNWELIICDDGSTDETVSIIEKYSKVDKRINYSINQSNKHGWQINFQKLILSQDDTADYFMFCDHDDIWDIDKISCFVTSMNELQSEFGSDSPSFVYGNMRIIDEYDHITSPDFDNIFNIELKSLTDSFFTQRVYGCNMIFNQSLMKLTQAILAGKRYPILSHDGLVVKVAAVANGKFRYLNQTTMCYRRTGTNATAKQEFGYTKSRILKRVSHIGKLAKDQSATYRQSLEFVRIASRVNLNDIDSDILKDMKIAIRFGGFTLLRIWKKYHINCGNRMRSLSHFIILFLGLHKKFL